MTVLSLNTVSNVLLIIYYEVLSKSVVASSIRTIFVGFKIALENFIKCLCN